MKNIKSRYIYAAMALMMLVFMVYYSNVQSFWHDELYQLGLVGKGTSFGTMMKNYFELWDYTPPLYAIIVFVWTRLVPLSERWLLIPSEIFVTVGVYILCICSEKVAGRKAGVVTAVFATTSSTLILGAGHEFRAYGLFFLATTILIYVLIRRYEDREDTKMTVFYTASIVLLAYSHYYGIITIVALFLFEVLQVLKKKNSIKVVIPYITAGVLYLPLVIMVLLRHRTTMFRFWTEKPNWRSVLDVLKYLTNMEPITYVILIAAILLACYNLIYSKKEELPLQVVTQRVSLWVIVFVIGVMYIYAAIINPKGGAFYDRYFMGILPFVIILLVIALKQFYQMGVFKEVPVNLAILILLGYLASTNFTYSVEDANRRREPYRQSIEVLKDKGDIEKPKTAIIITDCIFVLRGYEYYFNNSNKVNVDMISQEDENFNNLILRYDKLYVLAGHNKLTKTNKKLLLKQFNCLYTDRKSRISAYKRN